MKLLNEFYCFPDTIKNPLCSESISEIDDDMIKSYRYGCQLNKKKLLIINSRQGVSVNFGTRKIKITTYSISDSNIHAEYCNETREYFYKRISNKVDLYDWFLFVLTCEPITISDLESMLTFE